MEEEMDAHLPSDDLIDEPIKANVMPGAVVLLGPDAVSVAITPEAAIKSAEILKKAGEEALRLKKT